MALKKTKDTELEEVYIPKESRGDDSLFISVNGRRMLVQKGKPLVLPKAFAEVVRNSQAQDLAAQKYIDDNIME